MDSQPDPSPDFQRETAALRRIARGILLEPGLAEDAVQETWLAAIRSAKSNSITGGWLTEAVRRIALGLRRNEARRTHREQSAARLESLPSTADTSSRVELLRELLAALDELEEPYKTAVELRLVDDLPPREIAARTHVPVETARTRIKRGIERLRQRLDAQNAHRRDDFLAALAPLAIGHGMSSKLVSLHALKWIEGVWMSAQTKFAAAVLVALTAGLLWFHPWSSEARTTLVTTHEADASAIDKAAQVKNETRAIDDPARLDETHRTAAIAAQPDVTATNTWIVRGRAQRAHDAVFPGAFVEVVVITGYEGAGETLAKEVVTSDEHGAFLLAIPPPTVAVRVRAQVRMPDTFSFTSETLALRGADAPHDLVASCCALDVVLRGRVRDAEAKPVRGAHVECLGDIVDTDDDGRFEVRSCSYFETSRVSAWASAFAERMVTVTSAAPGVIEGVDIALAKSIALHGRVVNDSGSPIEGAEIQAFGFSRAKARSAADGRFVLDGLRSDKSWLGIRVKAPGFTRLSANYSDGLASDQEVEFVLQRGVDLVGRVVDEHGNGVPGATLFAGRSESDVDTVSGIAGDEGAFALRDVARSVHILNAAAHALAATVVSIEIPAQGPMPELRIVLTQGAEVAGVVVDATSAPLGKTTVWVLRDGNYLSESRATTNAEGRFVLRGVPSGTGLELEIAGAGVVRKRVPLDVADAKDLRVVMQHTASLMGRVIDRASGTPITKFRVRFIGATYEPGDDLSASYSADWAEPGHEFHDEKGEWNTKGEDMPAGSVVGLEISATGFGPVIVPRALLSIDAAKSPIVTALGPAARIAGVVVDARNGQPIPGASVRCIAQRLMNANSSLDSDEARRTTTISDDAGRFTFDGLAFEPVSLYVDRVGFAAMTDGPFEAEASTAARRIELSAGATVRGVVHDSAGRSVANVPVQLSTSGDQQPFRSWQLTTDLEGRFELANVAPGKYQAAREIRHEHGSISDLSRDFTVESASTYEIDLRPQGRCTLRGEMRGVGAEVAIVQITAFMQDRATPDKTVWRAAVAQGARFEIEGLVPGHWKFSAREAGAGQKARMGFAELDIGDGTEATVTIDLRGP